MQKKMKNKNVSTPHFPSPPTFLEHSIQPCEFEGGDERGVHAVHLQDVSMPFSLAYVSLVLTKLGKGLRCSWMSLSFLWAQSAMYTSSTTVWEPFSTRDWRDWISLYQSLNLETSYFKIDIIFI